MQSCPGRGSLSCWRHSHCLCRTAAHKLLALPQSDPHAAEGLLPESPATFNFARKAFTAMHRKQKIAAEWVSPSNEILRITEGHDEIDSWRWRLAHGNSSAAKAALDWLLAAIAVRLPNFSRGSRAPLRLCANPQLRPLLYDKSRTIARRGVPCRLAEPQQSRHLAARHSVVHRDV